MARTTRLVPPTTLWSSLRYRTCEILEINPDEAPSDLAFAGLIGRGLPVHVINGLMKSGISESDIFHTVIARRTLQHRRAARKPLTANESDRAERMARIVALAYGVFEDMERAQHWLKAPKRRFGGQRPLDLIGSSIGAKLLEESLVQAYFGNVA